jgi:hypothetical protein
MLLLAGCGSFALLLQAGFASLGGLLEALELLLVSSKIVILLQAGFASLVGCLDLLSRHANEGIASTSDYPFLVRSAMRCE